MASFLLPPFASLLPSSSSLNGNFLTRLRLILDPWVLGNPWQDTVTEAFPFDFFFQKLFQLGPPCPHPKAGREGTGATWFLPVAGLGPGACSVVSPDPTGSGLDPRLDRGKLGGWGWGKLAGRHVHGARKKAVVALGTVTNEPAPNPGIWGPQRPTLSQTLQLGQNE